MPSARMVFWVYLGSQSYLRGGEGRERERERDGVAGCLFLACDTLTRQRPTGEFFKALAAVLTVECRVGRPPSEKRTAIRRVQSLGGGGRRRDLLHRPPDAADPQKVEAINRNRHLHLTFRSPAAAAPATQAGRHTTAPPGS